MSVDHLAELTFSIVSPTELDVDEVRRVYESSGLGDRRPIHEPGRLRRMLDGANLIVVAVDADGMIGIARSISDFSYVTYLSDLAVAAEWQRRGVGRTLVRVTAEAAPQAKIVLLSAPNSVDYYPHVGFTQHPSAWTLPAPSA